MIGVHCLVLAVWCLLFYVCFLVLVFLPFLVFGPGCLLLTAYFIVVTVHCTCRDIVSVKYNSIKKEHMFVKYINIFTL